MPKQVFTVNDFSKGLNTDTSPRALEDGELQYCTNMDPSSKGTIKTSCKFVDGASIYADVTQTTAVDAGYGLFAFANDNVINNSDHGDYQGEFIVKADGVAVDILEPQTSSSTWTENVLGSNDIPAATPCFYAAEGDLYVGGDFTAAPASFKFHHQKKFNGPAETVTDWIAGTQQRLAPVRGADMNVSERSTDDGVDDGSNTITGLGVNKLNWIIRYGADNSGGWTNTVAGVEGAGNFIEFAGSWLYKGGLYGAEAESDLTELETGSSNGSSHMDYSANTHADATIQVQAWTSVTPSTAVALSSGALPHTIYGARLYARVNNTSEWYLLAEANYEKGIKGSLETEYQMWVAGHASVPDFDHSADGHQATTGIIVDPPLLISYKTNNGHSTADLVADNKVYFKTAVVANSRAYVGNVSISGRTYGDRILKSPIFEYDLFTENSYVDVASNDGDQITALAAFGDTLLEFKNDMLYLIDISKEMEHLTEARRSAGVKWQAAVTTTAFGVVWVNNNGCYLYDGSEVKQLQFGKISDKEWTTNITDNATIGYDSINQQIIVLWNATDAGTGDAYVFALDNGSWYLVDDIVSDAVHCSNMVNARDDKLLILGGSGNADIFYLDNPRASGSTATIDMRTKVFDLGNPESKKNITEVAVVYKYGSSSGLTITISTDDGASFDTVGSLTTATAGPTTQEISLVGNADFQNKKTFQIKISGTADDLFELLSITLTYRDLGVH